MIEIAKLEMKHCDALAEIMSTDTDLHAFLYETPPSPMPAVSATKFYENSKAWETKKNGVTFSILTDGVPIGTISYIHEDEQTASVGMWITSTHWNGGYGTAALSQFKDIVKAAGYAFLTGSIQKTNPRSKRVAEKLGATFPMDIERAPGGHAIDHDNKWYPCFVLQ